MVFTGTSGQVTGPTITFPSTTQTLLGVFRLGAIPASTKTLFGWGSNGWNFAIRSNGKLTNPSGAVAPETYATGQNYLIGYTYADGELHYFVGGRFSRPHFATFPSGVSALVAGAAALNAAVGHVAMGPVRLTAGEWHELARLARGAAVPPVFNDAVMPASTDPFWMPELGRAATATVDNAASPDPMFGGRGKRITAGGPRPSLTVAITANTAVPTHPAAVTEYCAGKVCGSPIQANASFVRLKPAAGQTVGKPIHVACLVIDEPGVTQPNLRTMTGTPTAADWQRSVKRMIRDQVANKAIKTIGTGVGPAGKGHYLSVNERDHTTSPGINGAPGSATEYYSGLYAIYDNPNATTFEMPQLQTESALAIAVLHRKHNLPKDSWTRAYVEQCVDFMVAQMQGSSGQIGAGTSDDFFFCVFGQIIKLMGPYVPSSKYTTWKNALVALANRTIGKTTGSAPYNGTYCINSNRNLQNMLGVWMTYLVTGDLRWKRVFELQYKIFCGGMPAVGSFAAAPARGSIETVPAPGSGAGAISGATAGDWGSGGPTHVWNSLPAPHTEPTHLPYGFYTVRAPTQADGSDGIGFLSEAPFDGTESGPDQNYVQYMLAILSMMLPWTDYDPRLVYISNMMLNWIWPYISQAGGEIYRQNYQDATHNTVGGAIAVNDSYTGPWSLDVQGGVRFKGYVAQIFHPAMPWVLHYNGLRASKPTGVPAAIHPAGVTSTNPSGTVYGPAYYSPYQTLTPTILKSQFAAIEKYFEDQTIGAMGPAAWMEMAKYQAPYVLNDPDWTLPTTPGAS